MKAKLTLSCGTGELQQVILLAIQFWLCAGVRVDAHPSGRCRIGVESVSNKFRAGVHPAMWCPSSLAKLVNIIRQMTCRV